MDGRGYEDELDELERRPLAYLGAGERHAMFHRLTELLEVAGLEVRMGELSDEGYEALVTRVIEAMKRIIEANVRAGDPPK